MHPNLIIFSSRTKDSPEDVLMQNIKICADAVNTNVIEHTAFIRASAAQNNLDLDEYREQVRKELQASKEQKATKQNGNYQ